MNINSVRLLAFLLFSATFVLPGASGSAHARPEMPLFQEEDGSWKEARPAARDRMQARNSPAARDRRSQPTRQMVSYKSTEKPGTIIIDTTERTLHLVLDNGKALRYMVGVGREGFAWSGTERISRKAEWPSWRPPEAMRKRQPYLPAFMPGGPNNPMGARAIYLGATLYRIHGTTESWSVGEAMSSGCIRMLNEDVLDLYERVNIGAKVIVS